MTAPSRQRERSSRTARFIPVALWVAVTAAILTTVASVDLVYGNDSNHYIDIAHTLKSGQLAHYHLDLSSRTIPDRAIPWPPLFPAMLALLVGIGASDQFAFRAVAIAAHAASCWCLFSLVRRFGGKYVACLAVTGWAFTIAYTTMTGYAFSEPLFIALSLGMVVALTRVLEVWEPTFVSLAIAGLLGGGASLTRDIGFVAAPLTIAVAAFVIFRMRAIRPLLVMAGGFIPAGLWLLYRQSVAGRSHVFGATRLISNLYAAAKTMGADLAVPIGVTVAVLIAAASVGDWLRHPPPHAPIPIVVLVCLSWTVCYTAVLLAAATAFNVDPIGTRLLSPVYPEIIAVLFFVIVRSCEVVGLRLWSLRPEYSQAALALTLFAFSGSVFLGYAKTRSPAGTYPGVECIQKNAPAGALIVAKIGCPLRAQSGRVVLESSYPQQPPLTAEGVAEFLQKWNGRFEAAYYIQQDRPSWAPPKPGEQDDASLLNGLAARGYQIKPLPGDSCKGVIKISK